MKVSQTENLAHKPHHDISVMSFFFLCLIFGVHVLEI